MYVYMIFSHKIKNYIEMHIALQDLSKLLISCFLLFKKYFKFSLSYLWNFKTLNVLLWDCLNQFLLLLRNLLLVKEHSDLTIRELFMHFSNVNGFAGCYECFCDETSSSPCGAKRTLWQFAFFFKYKFEITYATL